MNNFIFAVKKYKSVSVVALVLLLLQGVMQDTYIRPTWSNDYSSHDTEIDHQLAPDQILLQLFGFREFLAGILWVRADGFFDSGNYDAILPIIRLCTVLDPHQIDIYSVGMWHIAYNFTDQDQRSDRRYIPIALALGKDGVEHNPNTYELYFENGWTYYNKIQDDYSKAVEWFEKSSAQKDVIPAKKDLLANAYFKAGEVDKGLAWYEKIYKDDVKLSNEDNEYSNTQIRDTVENNIDNTIIRMMQRGTFARERNDGSYAKGDYDTKNPFNIGFSAKITVVRPRVLKVEGTWNVLPVGTHIRCIIRDKNYPDAKAGELDWEAGEKLNFELPTNLTYCQDDLFVKDKVFTKQIDMSKDLTMYPFQSDDFIVEFYYNARNAPAHMQDKFGYNGSGMTDTHFANKTIRPGAMCIYTTLPLSKDEILMHGDWANRHYSSQTMNYKDVTTNQADTDFVKVPTLRGN